MNTIINKLAAPEPGVGASRGRCGMSVGTLLLAVLLFARGALQADDEKLATLKAGSEVFSNVTITAVSATDIYFTHSRGLGNAKLKTLEPGLQKKFHFDPVKAVEKEQLQTQEQARYRQALLRAKPAKRPGSPSEAGGQSQDSTGADHEIFARSFLNQPVPTIMAENWIRQPPALEGKFLLLEFWATWSGPCRSAIPHLNALQHKFADHLVVLGLSDETEADVRRLTSPPIEYAIAIDSQHRALTAVGVERIPHAMLIDPKGIVRFEGNPGYLDEQLLEKLLSQYGD